jgi:hypothetical protein
MLFSQNMAKGVEMAIVRLVAFSTARQMTCASMIGSDMDLKLSVFISRSREGEKLWLDDLENWKTEDSKADSFSVVCWSTVQEK